MGKPILYHFIPYARLQEALSGSGRELEKEIRALIEKEALVELKCPLCGGLHIQRFIPGSLDKPCPSCRLSIARDGDEPSGASRREAAQRDVGREVEAHGRRARERSL